MIRSLSHTPGMLSGEPSRETHPAGVGTTERHVRPAGNTHARLRKASGSSDVPSVCFPGGVGKGIKLGIFPHSSGKEGSGGCLNEGPRTHQPVETVF